MKTSWLLRAYKIGILVILFGIMIHAPLSVAFGSLWPDYALVIKVWKEILLVLLLGTVVILLFRKNLWTWLLRDRIIQLMVGYGVLHIALIPFSDYSWASIIAGLMIDLRFVLFFVLCYVLVKIEPPVIKKIVLTLFSGAAVVVGFGLLQITVLPDDILHHIGYGDQTITPFTTIDKNPDFVRINSTLRGPNPLGAFCIIIISLILAYIVRYRNRLSYQKKVALLTITALSLVIVFSSYSRSAYLAVLIAAIATLFSLKNIRWSVQRIAVGLASIGVVAIGFMMIQSSDWYQNVVLHEDPESSVLKKSNNEHVRSLQTGLNQAIRQPIGDGIGSTGSASLYSDDKAGNIVENFYLFVAHETGWLGLGLFVAIVVIVQSRLWQQRKNWLALGMFTSGLGLAFIALLLPVWADETVALVWWGMTGAIMGGKYETKSRQ